MGKFFRKTFDIDLDDALQYPSAKTICETILKEEKNIEFLSTENPVTFKQNDVIYKVKVTIARGGYMLVCKEES